MQQAVGAAREAWGLATVCGVAGKGELLEVIPRLLITGRRVTGSSFGGVKGRTQVPQLVERWLAGDIDVESLLSHRLELDEVTRGFETAMGAIVGDFTSGGTLFICAFGAVMGLVLGLVYVFLRPFIPSRGWWRGSLFVYSATGLMLGLLIRVNHDDFAILPVTL